MVAVYVEISIWTCCPLSLPGNLEADVTALSCLWSGFLSCLPTAVESNCIRSLHLCLRQVWKCSCVQPGSYLWCFRPPGCECETKTILLFSTTSSDNPAARCELSEARPLLQTDVRDYLLANTWMRDPNLILALKHSWLRGVGSHHQRPGGAGMQPLRPWHLCRSWRLGKVEGLEGQSKRDFLQPLW